MEQLEPDEGRPSIAVLPFVDFDTGSDRGGLGDAFAHDTIVELSRRRWLTVIARGSTFQFQSAPVDLADIGRVLNVRYALTGTCHVAEDRLRVTSELAECATGQVVWADSFERPYREVFTIRRTISEQIATHASQEIEQAEIIRARDLEPADLGAWASYHRGLWHAFRFNAKDNELARQLFIQATEDDATFSSAYAALSFTYFQRAFLQYTDATDEEVHTALALAEQSLDLDPRNPRGHYAYGRACMLKGNSDASFDALETSILLEPSFAQGYYSLGFAQSQAGDPEEAIRNLQRADRLSPIDPLQFAFLASQALCHIRLGRFDDAATYAVRATGKPHAHAHTYTTAAVACMLTGQEEEARAHAEEIRKRNPDYTAQSFLIGFPNFAERDRETIMAALRDLGFA
jgi:TolB-like protein/Tfp pilus assembly protein PilF